MRSCDNKFILGVQVSLDVQSAKQEVLKDKQEIKLINNIEIIKDAKKLPKYLKKNLQIVLTTLQYLKPNENFDYTLPILFGRCQHIKPNITIDVGHNSLAATVLLREFYNKKIILIYNSYNNKNYQEILQILRPIIIEVQIIIIDDKRMVKKDNLMTICNDLNINVKKYDRIEENNQYLVFGSFRVVEEFLKKGLY
jgi:dihydrofolate synthase/folylpolyglutamate synthase